MVMLHLFKGKLLRARPLARKVFGVQVARHQGGSHVEQALVGSLRIEPRIVGLDVLHVAYVLRHESILAP